MAPLEKNVTARTVRQNSENQTGSTERARRGKHSPSASQDHKRGVRIEDGEGPRSSRGLDRLQKGGDKSGAPPLTIQKKLASIISDRLSRIYGNEIKFNLSEQNVRTLPDGSYQISFGMEKKHPDPSKSKDDSGWTQVVHFNLKSEEEGNKITITSQIGQTIETDTLQGLEGKGLNSPFLPGTLAQVCARLVGKYYLKDPEFTRSAVAIAPPVKPYFPENIKGIKIESQAGSHFKESASKGLRAGGEDALLRLGAWETKDPNAAEIVIKPLQGDQAAKVYVRYQGEDYLLNDTALFTKGQDRRPINWQDPQEAYSWFRENVVGPYDTFQKQHASKPR